MRGRSRRSARQGAAGFRARSAGSRSCEPDTLQEALGDRDGAARDPRRTRSTRGMRVQQAAVDQARALSELQASRLATRCKVRPASPACSSRCRSKSGQRVGPGTNLARVADPSRLKAELRIAETQAKDIEVGQSAEIDTRNGVIAGRVSRKDPAAANGTVTVDVTLTGELPARRGARSERRRHDPAGAAREHAVRRPAVARPGTEHRRPVQASPTTAGDAARVQVHVGKQLGQHASK